MTKRKDFSPMKAKNLLLTLAFTGLSVTAMAQAKYGTSGVAFLGIGVGPDAVGMGSAAVAYKQNVTALYWNPGAVGANPKSEVSFSKNYWLVGTKFDWVGVTLALDESSVLGMQFGNLSYGEEDVTTTEQEFGTGEKWDARDIYFGLTYSKAMTDMFAFGVTGKYIRSQIWHETASAFALDFGLLYSSGWNGLKLGMSVANFGTPVQYEGKDLINTYDPDPSTNGNNSNIPITYKTDSWDLPIFFRVGIVMDAYRDDMNALVVAADAMRPSNHNESINIGTEYIWNNMVSLRAGYKNLFRGQSDEGFAAGFGIAYPIFGYRLKFDGSFSQREQFDDVMIYSVSLEF